MEPNIQKNQNQEYRIVFPENIADIVKELIKKYNLKAIGPDFFETAEKDESLVAVEPIISGITVKIANNQISLTEVPPFLEKTLKISKDSAEKLTDDIKTQIVSLARKVAVEKEEEPEAPKIPEEPTQPITARPVRLIKENLATGQEKIVPEEINIVKEKIPPEKKLKEVKKQTTRKQDDYREPVE